MKLALIQTRCECQGRLSASVDESGIVRDGRVALRGAEAQNAPANAISAGSEQFQVGWLCPLCGRNSVRSFYTGALVFAEQTSA